MRVLFALVLSGMVLSVLPACSTGSGRASPMNLSCSYEGYPDCNSTRSMSTGLMPGGH